MKKVFSKISQNSQKTTLFYYCLGYKVFMAILGDSSKAFIRKCSAKKLILIISQISQENTLPYCYLGCIYGNLQRPSAGSVLQNGCS